jgi:hypothetical protein
MEGLIFVDVVLVALGIAWGVAMGDLLTRLVRERGKDVVRRPGRPGRLLHRYLLVAETMTDGVVGESGPTA